MTRNTEPHVTNQLPTTAELRESTEQREGQASVLSFLAGPWGAGPSHLEL